MYVSNESTIFRNVVFILMYLTLLNGCSIFKKSGITESVDTSKGKAISQISVTERCTDSDEVAKDNWDILNDPSSLGIVYEPQLEAYTNQVLQKLIRGWGGNAPKLKVRLTGSPEFTAYAYPGCVIYLSVETVNQSKREGEIAAILAHELSHVILNHSASNSVKNLWDGAAEYAPDIIKVIGKVSPGVQGLDNQDQVDSAAEAGKKFMKTFIMPTWTSEQEHEADILGIDLLAKSGYDPGEMYRMMQHVNDSSQMEDSTGWIGQTSETATADMGGEWTGKLINAGVNVVADGKVRTWFDEQSKDHQDTKIRIDTAKQYIDREYPDDFIPKAKQDSLTTIKDKNTASGQYLFRRNLATHCWKQEPASVPEQAKAHTHRQSSKNRPNVAHRAKPASDPVITADSVTFYEYYRMEQCHPKAYEGMLPLLHAKFVNDINVPIPWRLKQVENLLEKNQNKEALQILSLMETQFGGKQLFNKHKRKALAADGKTEEVKKIQSDCERGSLRKFVKKIASGKSESNECG